MQHMIVGLYVDMPHT